MNEKERSLDSLIKGGVIGATLGALLANDKEEGALVGALIGAAVLATINASETAKNSNVTVFMVEDGNLIEISPGGNKRVIKNIKKPKHELPNSFKLK